MSASATVFIFVGVGLAALGGFIVGFATGAKSARRVSGGTETAR